jgi:RNA polymerase sigma factor (TIGR02999 family)
MDAHNVTRLLNEWNEGDASAIDELFPLVYSELRRQARGYLKRERGNHTLQPTALVHEAYLRLGKLDQAGFENRAHFFAISAITMRRILVDHAREVAAEKRGGGLQRVTFENLSVPDEQKAVDLLELDAALFGLAKIDLRKARIVEMIFFGGMSYKEIAEVFDVTEKTIQRDWNFSKLWLYRELGQEPAWPYPVIFGEPERLFGYMFKEIERTFHLNLSQSIALMRPQSPSGLKPVISGLAGKCQLLKPSGVLGHKG